MKKLFKIGFFSIITLIIIGYFTQNIGESEIEGNELKTTNSIFLKYQNPNLKSLLIPSDNRINSEFEFMSDNIISTNIKVRSTDIEEESKLAKIIDEDLKIKGVYDINTIQTFNSQNNEISMKTKYKNFEYVIDYYNSENESIYKIDKVGNVIFLNN